MHAELNISKQTCPMVVMLMHATGLTHLSNLHHMHAGLQAVEVTAAFSIEATTQRPHEILEKLLPYFVSGSTTVQSTEDDLKAWCRY
jgi:hypothetical protein